MQINVELTTEVSRSTRARQVEAMMDVPASEKTTLTWSIDAPLEERDWQIGLITGPSGSGKTTIAREMFGEHFHPELEWGAACMMDDFAAHLPAGEISQACASVGLNTVPAWLRPFHVLSNGEQFRADLARRLLELDGPVVVDEFTSVVDRQVARIGSRAVGKYARKLGKRFVAVSCHDDIIDWLQPDWVISPRSTPAFRWRSVQPRPTIDVELRAVPRRLWALFAPFHYMSAQLPGGRYFALFVDSRPVAFASVSKIPHPKTKNLWRFPRVVTLPDWQGIGLIWHLMETLAKAWRGCGQRLRATPAHPAFIRAFERSKVWKRCRQAGRTARGHRGPNSTTRLNVGASGHSRTNAVYEFVGDAMPRAQARAIFKARVPAR